VKHTFITVAIPFASERVQGVNESLKALGNPARDDIATALGNTEFLHFMSITVTHPEPASRAYLILEASADGSTRAACARLAQTIGTWIVAVLQAAGLKIPRKLDAYLEKHRLNVGAGWFSTCGVLFTGTPGMSVQRIKREEKLALRIGEWLEHNRDAEPALQKLNRVRDTIFEIPELKWAFIAEPIPLLGQTPALPAAVLPLLGSLCRELLWPLLIPPVLAAIVFRAFLGSSSWQAIRDALFILGLELPLAGLGAYIAYLWLLRQEDEDQPKEELDAERLEQIMKYENIVMQNHLGGASFLKPGFVHRIILRVVFWMIEAWSTYLGRPGFLYNIGTIHFARWVILPRTNAMAFLSNYDGSWQSYLEDFIAHARVGLNAIWGNTLNFPKTQKLIEGGASDSARFKSWARYYQRPTHFWYSAYPNLKTSQIRTNASIRHGFATATTEKAAAEWLNSLGFPNPVATHLESEQIPTLVFGGLSPLRHAHCLIMELSGKPQDCRDWLRELAENLSYGDRVPSNSAIVAGFSASGLRKLGLEEPALGTFPVAFQQGMTVPWRTRALQDTGVNAPENWWWGGPGRQSDAILMLYAKESERLDEDVKHRTAQMEKYAHRMIHQIAMATLPPQDGAPFREPFGFIDGISQPIIRGTSRGTGQRPQNQVIAPGEMILGYPDNLGYYPPMPKSNGFPVGRNGTFLVARQLEQNPANFWRYIDDAAAVLAADPRSPSKDPVWVREWLAAKMVGRWREDGSSLVRHPTPPGTPGRTTDPQDNDFLFGAEDPDGVRCPFGAHIRRANPRDNSAPGSQEQIGITNRHRILRVGRSYNGADNGWDNPGLLFMCLNIDIERQFELLLQTWVLGRDFNGLQNDADPIVSQHAIAHERTMSVQTPAGPIHLPHMTDFVTVRGGGYFFMPGKAAVDFLVQS
jgi:deferrochelatase/peroxidase EfeB